jgi:hypothetical protein
MKAKQNGGKQPQLQPDAWKRCGNPTCGRKVKVTGNPTGRSCRKCGAPLSWARDI